MLNNYNIWTVLVLIILMGLAFYLGNNWDQLKKFLSHFIEENLNFTILQKGFEKSKTLPPEEVSETIAPETIEKILKSAPKTYPPVLRKNYLAQLTATKAKPILDKERTKPEIKIAFEGQELLEKDLHNWKAFLKTGAFPALNADEINHLKHSLLVDQQQIREFLESHYEELAQMGWEDLYQLLLKTYIEKRLAAIQSANPVNISENDLRFLEDLAILRDQTSKIARLRAKREQPRNELRPRLDAWGKIAAALLKEYQSLRKEFGFRPRPTMR